MPPRSKCILSTTASLLCVPHSAPAVRHTQSREQEARQEKWLLIFIAFQSFPYFSGLTVPGLQTALGKGFWDLRLCSLWVKHGQVWENPFTSSFVPSHYVQRHRNMLITEGKSARLRSYIKTFSTDHSMEKDAWDNLEMASVYPAKQLHLHYNNHTLYVCRCTDE